MLEVEKEDLFIYQLSGMINLPKYESSWIG